MSVISIPLLFLSVVVVSAIVSTHYVVEIRWAGNQVTRWGKFVTLFFLNWQKKHNNGLISHWTDLFTHFRKSSKEILRDLDDFLDDLICIILFCIVITRSSVNSKSDSHQRMFARRGILALGTTSTCDFVQISSLSLLFKMSKSNREYQKIPKSLPMCWICKMWPTLHAQIRSEVEIRP